MENSIDNGNSFISSKDNDEECVMHSESHNIEIMTFENADEAIKKLFETLPKRYQIGLEHQLKVVISYLIVLQLP